MDDVRAKIPDQPFQIPPKPGAQRREKYRGPGGASNHAPCWRAVVVLIGSMQFVLPVKTRLVVVYQCKAFMTARCKGLERVLQIRLDTALEGRVILANVENFQAGSSGARDGVF